MLTNKTIISNCLKLTAVSGILAVVSLPAQAEQWRGWNIHPPSYPNSVALESFAEEVAEKTEGRIEPKVYHNAVLGAQPDAIEQTRSGALDFANFNMGPMGPIVPATNILSLPFIFNSTEDMYRIMDGDIGGRFAEALAEKNLVALSWFGSGARSLYNTDHPVKTPDDVDGLKFRVMNNDLYVQMIDELGGNATPMAYSEVYQSLKTGVIDGAENNYPSYESSGHYEVAKYYSLTEHLILPECLCVAKSTWDEMSEEDQGIVREAAENAAQEQRKLWEERAQKSRELVLESGVEINEVDDKAAFQDKMQPIYDDFVEENPELETLVKDIQAAQE
ncbi:TRAP transporter substrate-binding protein [Halomonas elongata]|uniref:TRAP transporter substrate-binding protein n=1 Tax=Halomonas elongata (strain ATCC 33173 / DSM 2581 / NBRC 15536 / NCIMB 2198 / 1H9) TaxID=768066 RepID=E1V6R5_HALED|nr:TRAP transporter substrate-binding protein [Halomonas elongata]WBF17047.1 TRAP transporter substrate-binding protein [Halomonas elongata]WPU45879.1 TRAP transporter substrate-binding protein [Halomonas elongata DSM 2581]CBV43294.1 TRAP transporter substrate-binding protein (probable substrate D-glucuronate/D-galacturonate) [Halomonas elongata DSM 2581]